MEDIIRKEPNKPLNLKKTNRRISLITPIKTLIVGGVLFVYFFNLTAFAPGLSSPYFNATFAAEHNDETSVETIEGDIANLSQSELEDRLAELERQMADQRRLIEETQAQSRSLESEIQRFDAEIKQAEYRIEAINLTLQKLAEDIIRTEDSIEETENKIGAHKTVLAKSLRNIYETENQSLLVILLQNNQISDFFNNINNILMVQDNVQASLETINNLREQLIEEKESLQTERTEADSLRNMQQAQRNRLDLAKQERAELLEATRNQESRYQEILEETRKTAQEVRNQIIQFVTGEELNFETAYQLASFAEEQTGIRAALVLAILDKESNLGRNVGQCTITDTTSGATEGINTGRVFSNGIHPTRDLPILLRITQELGVDPTNTPVSCPLSVGYGGAMGPSQFIPSTWAIYKNRIASTTGNNPPNPWENIDAITATSIYISDLYGDNTCTSYANEPGIKNRWPEQELREECAAARYYSGGYWRSPANYYGYGVDVRERADRYQRDIDILEGRS